MAQKLILSSKFILASLLVILAGGCSGNNGAIDGTGTIEAREIDVSALVSGTVERLLVREGDRTEKGDLLAELDHEILDLRLKQAVSREKQARSQLELLKAGARSEDIEQAEARLSLVESKLERVRILAPFRGMVLSGDLTQQLGGAVTKGEVLFEIAPLDAYRVILEVDERRIADVRQGQQGRMILSALPNRQFDFVVRKITPIAMAKEGLNYFRVEAELLGASARLRPGMEGIGKIYVEEKRLIAIWTRDLVEWVKLWLWSWYP